MLEVITVFPHWVWVLAILLLTLVVVLAILKGVTFRVKKMQQEIDLSFTINPGAGQSKSAPATPASTNPAE